MEWYDPGQITTKDGALVIEMREEPTHEFDYRSGMLQSWNKFCFSKNAYIEGESRGCLYVAGAGKLTRPISRHSIAWKYQGRRVLARCLDHG